MNSATKNYLPVAMKINNIEQEISNVELRSVRRVLALISYWFPHFWLPSQRCGQNRYELVVFIDDVISFIGR